jgi:hypothetical protein
MGRTGKGWGAGTCRHIPTETGAKVMKIANNTHLEKALKIDGNHSAANAKGLYLSVRGAKADDKSAGSKRWIYRYKFQNQPGPSKLKEMALGVYGSKPPGLTMAQAADAAAAQRLKHRFDKVDPIAARQAEADAIATVAPVVVAPTFREDVQAHYEKWQTTWNRSYARDRMARMTKHVFPTLGDRDTATITARDIFAVVSPIWGSLQTAPRILDEISAVIEQAMAVDEERFQRGNPAPITRKMLTEGVQPETKSHGAMPWQQAPALYAKLLTSDKPQAHALRFLLLCCTPRTDEVLGSLWSEIAGDAFRVPANRLKSGRKTGKGRTIPLSAAAQALLADIRPAQAEGFIFKSGWQGRVRKGVFVPFSGAMQKDVMNLLYRKLMPDGTDAENGRPWDVHGLRATFRGWVKDNAKTFDDNDAAEIALDHVLGTKVQRAYDRGDMLTQRRDLAERWSQFLHAIN